MVFSDLWVGWVVKTTLAPKFGGPAQRWSRAGLGKGGAGWNLGPPCPHLSPSPSSPPSPWPWGGGGQGAPVIYHSGKEGPAA
jgi:hypothetical protein